MEIKKTESDGIVTFKLKGCLDTAASAEFAAAVEGAAEAKAIVFDMSELEFIASSALRTLVATKKKRGASFSIALVGLNEVVREVFDVTGLDAVFEIREA